MNLCSQRSTRKIIFLHETGTKELDEIYECRSVYRRCTCAHSHTHLAARNQIMMCAQRFRWSERKKNKAQKLRNWVHKSTSQFSWTNTTMNVKLGTIAIIYFLQAVIHLRANVRTWMWQATKKRQKQGWNVYKAIHQLRFIPKIITSYFVCVHGARHAKKWTFFHAVARAELTSMSKVPTATFAVCATCLSTLIDIFSI